MLELFMQGGSLFMGILSLLFLCVLSLTVVYGKQVFSKNDESINQLRQRLTYIKSIGLFSLVFGVLGQLIGLFTAFGTMAQINSVSPAILTSGIRVSMITTLFGMIIFLISYLTWMGLDYKLNNIIK